MQQYKIEKNVKKVAGERFKTGQAIWNYPLEEMSVGDSFAIPDEKYDRKNIAKIRGRIRYIVEKTKNRELKKMQFSIGRDPKSKEIIRVWRIN